MKLYKYMAYRDGLFDNLLFRFSPARLFNDPFEGQVTISSVRSHIKENFTFKDKKEITSLLNKVSRRNHVEPYPNVGIFCLSQSVHSLLMWAHYADNHRGIIIGFDSDHPFFDQDILPSKPNEDTRWLGKIFPVAYDRVRLNFTANLGYKALLIKSDEWMYEKEYRMFMRRNDRTKYAEDECGNVITDIDLFEIPATAVREVIIGVKANKNKIVKDFKLASAVSAKLSHIKLFQAKIHPEIYHIIHNPIY